MQPKLDPPNFDKELYPVSTMLREAPLDNVYNRRKRHLALQILKGFRSTIKKIPFSILVIDEHLIL